MTEGNQQMHYEFPFDFAERVPVHTASVNGTVLDRFLFDTGAPDSYLHADAVTRLGLHPTSKATVHVDSLRFGNWDVGPTDFLVGSFGKGRIDGLLGTRQVAPYRVALDLDRSICVLGDTQHGDAAFSAMELFRGRPVVHVQHAGTNLRFVLDTGSDANWLFVPGQNKLSGIGDTVEQHPEKVTATGQDLTIRRAKVVHNMSIGGKDLPEVRFLLSDPQATFGGHRAPEDGILGVGALVSCGQVVLDFPGGRFLLTEKICHIL